MKLQPFTIVSLWDMIEANIANISMSVASIGAFWKMLRDRDQAKSAIGYTVSRDQAMNTATALYQVNIFADSAGCPITKEFSATLLERMTSLVASNGVCNPDEAAQIQQELEALIAVMPEEFKTKKAFVVKNTLSKYYVGGDADSAFGERVEAAFYSTTVDANEASNCLALGRWTACVLHCMRVLEAGLEALAKEVGLSKPPVSWNKTLNEIDKHLAEIAKGLRKFNKNEYGEDHEQWAAEAGTHLRFVKNAFRNCSAHRHISFDEDRAVKVFHGSKEFMEHLASRLTDAED